MVDNTSINTGTGESIATDDVGGVKHQRVKVEYGADGEATDVSYTNPLPNSPIPNATVGLSTFRSIDLDEGAAEVVKASPGQIYGIWVCNRATTTRYVKFYDALTAAVGTDTPKITLPIPGNTSDDVTGLLASPHGINFATGICVGASTGLADNDTGAPDLNDVIINIFYK